jgi:hypothetical protein
MVRNVALAPYYQYAALYAIDRKDEYGYIQYKTISGIGAIDFVRQ